MQIQIKIDAENAAQEAVWLQEYIAEHNLEGVDTEIQKETPEEGTMDGGVLSGIVIAAITAGATLTIEKLLELVFEHLKRKPVSFKLTAKYPDKGMEMEIQVENSRAADREKIIEEFKRYDQEING